MVATFTVTGPSDWAPYLVNGDASGLSPEDIAQADAWLEREGVAILGTTDDEPRFTWSLALHAPECGCAGGMVIDYIATPVHAEPAP